ncbi:dTDP-4-dehydrorhamnose reductase [Ottowia sp.]|uniref:dTDP-4-dehydrorhamnose reductase n=1 Tax=Ottowia sp. TaxID=1898956 RepID=UPI002BF67319|nr:dTDP-4-dehydrorhamnose reductase [Ottowia sp.]
MNILLLGKNGQVGWELQRSLAPLGRVIALDRRGEGSLCGDLADLDGLAATVRAVQPQVIVNAAAHTAVDRAQAEPELAERINAQAPAVLARAAAACGALLLHYSTDYVFDGSGQTPWQEGDATGPLSVYGRTKLAGEQAIVQSGCVHLILRTSWVYAARGANFAKTMLRLAAERERLTVIDDQWGAPTGAELIADVSAHAIAQVRAEPAKAGLYHLAAAGETTWFSYANHVLAQARQAQPAIELKATEVVPVASSHFPTPARRPHNSRLDTRKLQAAFGLVLPPWQAGVNRMLLEIL